jgi:3-methyladenine DNA glycosylase AlkC
MDPVPEYPGVCTTSHICNRPLSPRQLQRRRRRQRAHVRRNAEETLRAEEPWKKHRRNIGNTEETEKKHGSNVGET